MFHVLKPFCYMMFSSPNFYPTTIGNRYQVYRKHPIISTIFIRSIYSQATRLFLRLLFHFFFKLFAPHFRHGGKTLGFRIGKNLGVGNGLRIHRGTVKVVCRVSKSVGGQHMLHTPAKLRTDTYSSSSHRSPPSEKQTDRYVRHLNFPRSSGYRCFQG